MKNKFDKISEKEWETFLDKLKGKGIALDKIDINALSPKDTTAEVLYTFCKEQYGLDLRGVPTSVKELKNQQEKYENLIRTEIQKQEAEAEKSFMESLEQIEKDKTSDIIEKIFFIPKQYAKMVAQKFSNGLILFGEGGLGKTYSVLRAFKEEGVDFCICSGYTTPLQLYTYLYENRTRHILLDDVAGLLDNKISLDILKCALYSPKGVRKVSYNSSSAKLEVPSDFIFEGTITILVNEMRHNQDLKAVADRVLYHELKLNYQQVISVLFELAKQNYKDMSREERFVVATWIKDNTTIATKNLNLRFLFKCFEFYRYDKNKWEDLAKESILTDDRLLKVKDLLNSNVSVKTACMEFIERGLGSRASFFRIKKKLNM